jgi:hypothetical protein
MTHTTHEGRSEMGAKVHPARCEIQDAVYEATRLYGFKRLNLMDYTAAYLGGEVDADEYVELIRCLVDDPEAVVALIESMS